MLKSLFVRINLKLSLFVCLSQKVQAEWLIDCLIVGPGPLDVRIKRLARERDDLQDMNRRLKLDLEEEKNLSSSARGANAQQEIERWVVVSSSIKID